LIDGLAEEDQGDVRQTFVESGARGDAEALVGAGPAAQLSSQLRNW
jgi:hypothetical protein